MVTNYFNKNFKSKCVLSASHFEFNNAFFKYKKTNRYSSWMDRSRIVMIINQALNLIS